MNNKFYFFVVLSCILFLISGLFIFSTKLVEDDKLYQQEFNLKYNIYSVVKPDILSFAGESVPIYSDEIWERLDKQLLKNTYWQSNTMLYFKRANKYFPIIEPILQQYDIPEDFKYLAVIESGLDNVVSPSGASGFWQIMKSTGKSYGLEINKEVDERYNLEKATIVACRYLQEAYYKFGNWTMAAASYNMGMNGARRMILEQSSNNFYNLFLNSETSQYIFRIIAIKEIMQNPRKYGFFIRKKDLYNMPNFKSIEVDSTIKNLSDFASLYKVNYKLLKQLNPWLRSKSLPDESRKKYFIKIPIDTNMIVFDDIQFESYK